GHGGGGGAAPAVDRPRGGADGRPRGGGAVPGQARPGEALGGRCGPVLLGGGHTGPVAPGAAPPRAAGALCGQGGLGRGGERVASASRRAVGSRPMRRPWSVRRRPAKAWYVEITGSPGGLSGSMTSGSVTPALTSALRTRSASSPAALLVKVRPRTCSGATCPVPTSHTTRA